MGWRQEGILDGVYARLNAEGHKDARDELARRTGIQGTNLSGINSGKRDMTAGYAKRIAEAVDGVTPLDLGADDDITQPARHYTTADLGEMMAQARRAQNLMIAELERIANAVRDIESFLRPLAEGQRNPPQRRRSTG